MTWVLQVLTINTSVSLTDISSVNCEGSGSFLGRQMVIVGIDTCQAIKCGLLQ